MTAEPYELVVAPPAQRALAAKLPEPVAVAVIDFLTTALVEDSQRVGKQLRNELREVVVLRIEHRRDAYRPS